jgi:hypothetical protein
LRFDGGGPGRRRRRPSVLIPARVIEYLIQRPRRRQRDDPLADHHHRIHAYPHRVTGGRLRRTLGTRTGLRRDRNPTRCTPQKVLRFRNPELVKQESWTYLLTHYAVGVFMAEAVEDLGEVDPPPGRRPGGTFPPPTLTTESANLHRNAAPAITGPAKPILPTSHQTPNRRTERNQEKLRINNHPRLPGGKRRHNVEPSLRTYCRAAAELNPAIEPRNSPYAGNAQIAGQAHGPDGERTMSCRCGSALRLHDLAQSSVRRRSAASGSTPIPPRHM